MISQAARRGLFRLGAAGGFAFSQVPAPKRIEMFINDKPCQVEPNLTIYQACKENGVVIPRFCYHERLKIAGNCRMCLVEVAKSPKPVASCCSQVAPAMRVYTHSETTRLARGGVLEFILINHPLDCPICDQGGECDLQNNAHDYGYRASRYNEFKRAVEDKNFGPLVVTHMNRCIHCTRCIRFASEIGGFDDLGTTGRGRSTQIGTYVQKMLTSELSGNLHDVCPVGALNNGPFAFTSRPYELLSKSSIDVMDALGSHTITDYKDNVIMRVSPNVNEEINEEWLSDKSRHGFDGLKRQRLLRPLLRDGENFVEHDWQDIFALIRQKLDKVDGAEIAAGIGEFEDVESILALKDFLNSLNCFNYEFRRDANLHIDPTFRSNYLFNSRIQGIEDADAILLVGVNPRTQAPVLNSRILKATRKHGAKVYVVGNGADLTYPYTHLGTSASTLNQLFQGQHPATKSITSAKHPMIIVGRDLLVRSDAPTILQGLKKFSVNNNIINPTTGWNGFNVLHRNLGEINALELGLDLVKKVESPKVVFLLGCDNWIQPSDIPKDAFVVYIGTHGDVGAQYADVVLPAAAYTEKSGTYVNTEGRVQFLTKIVEPPGQAKEAWSIFRALSEECGITLPYDSLEEVRVRLFELTPHLAMYNGVEPSAFGKIGLKVETEKGKNGQIFNTPISFTMDNFYMTDAITRASVVMAKCSTAFNPKRHANFRKIGN